MNRKTRRNGAARLRDTLLLAVLTCLGTPHTQAAPIQEADKQRLLSIQFYGGKVK